MKTADGEKVIKKTNLSTDLFKGKVVPEFIRNHSVFKTPVEVQKVFPAIGLPNFQDKANVDKCLIDVRKEGTYVHNLLKVMAERLNQVVASIAQKADKVQYLESKKDREASRAALTEFYSLSTVIGGLVPCVDPYNKDVLAEAIQSSEGRIALKLMRNVQDANGKLIFRKDESLFKIFNKIKDKCVEFGIPFTPIDQTEAFKIFSKENIPNKEFNIVFSSTGPDGAWDILTMSMRGIKSCQRWDGEYPRCLVGSILSKFVGLIYLTSGVQSDTNGEWTNLGTKMMRRSVIRFAIDADEGKPCILIDRMYPELDKDILSLFVSAIKSRTELPVYYAQDLGNKLRHIYLPSEPMDKQIINRERSYQDTGLKSQEDINVFYLNHNKDEIERETKAFIINMGVFVANRLEDVFNGNISVDPEIKKTIKNIRMNTPFTAFSNQLVGYVLNSFKVPTSRGCSGSRSYYRKYLMEFLRNKKQISLSCAPTIIGLVGQNTSRTVDTQAFTNYIFSIVTAFVKHQIKEIIN